MGVFESPNTSSVHPWNHKMNELAPWNGVIVKKYIYKKKLSWQVIFLHCIRISCKTFFTKRCTKWLHFAITTKQVWSSNITIIFAKIVKTNSDRLQINHIQRKQVCYKVQMFSTLLFEGINLHQNMNLKEIDSCCQCRDNFLDSWFFVVERVRKLKFNRLYLS